MKLPCRSAADKANDDTNPPRLRAVVRSDFGVLL